MLRRLSRTKRVVALALVGGTVMAGCALADNNDKLPADWRAWNLGAFRMQAPSGLKHVVGGTD